MRNDKNYNIGLDIGTSSVGWAIVEENNQKIFKKGGKALWGLDYLMKQYQQRIED